MLEGLMQDFQPTVGAIRRRMARCYGDREVVTLQEAPAAPTRATYAEVAERVERLGHVLERLGVKSGERVGTFGWNSQDPTTLRTPATRMAGWQVPDTFAFVDEVPKTGVGKFDRKLLRKRLADGELEIAGDKQKEKSGA